jgi:hypothetical protein
LRRPPSEYISPRHCAIVDAFAAGPPSLFAYHRQPLSCRSFTEHQSLSPTVDGWLSHSPPTQQDTDHITKQKMFPVSTHPLGLILTYVLLRE